MGNCCGKSSSDNNDNFSTPGRVLGSTPAPQARAPMPQGRTLGGGGGGGGRFPDGASSSPPPCADPKSAAAEAAEARAKTSSATPKGKLGQALAEERRGTRSDTLAAVSAEERRRRDMQQGIEARHWN